MSMREIFSQWMNSIKLCYSFMPVTALLMVMKSVRTLLFKNDWIPTQIGLQKWSYIGLCTCKVSQWTALAISGLSVLSLVTPLCSSLCLSFHCIGFTAKQDFFGCLSQKIQESSQNCWIDYVWVHFWTNQWNKGVEYPDWSDHVSAPFPELMGGVSPLWTTQTDSAWGVVFQRRIRVLFPTEGDWVLHKQGTNFTCLTFICSLWWSFSFYNVLQIIRSRVLLISWLFFFNFHDQDVKWCIDQVRNGWREFP